MGKPNIVHQRPVNTSSHIFETGKRVSEVAAKRPMQQSLVFPNEVHHVPQVQYIHSKQVVPLE